MHKYIMQMLVYSKSSGMSISPRCIWDAFIKEVERYVIKLYLITIACLVQKHVTQHLF